MTTRQVAMVIDLNKCIGCQACTAACKSLWTDEEGQEYMLWNNVETKPGPGYPHEWEEKGKRSGWKDGKLLYGGLHEDRDFGKPSQLNHEALYFQGTEARLQRTEPSHACVLKRHFGVQAWVNRSSRLRKAVHLKC